MFKQTLKSRERPADYLFFNTTGLPAQVFDEVVTWCEERFGKPAFDCHDEDERWGGHSVSIGREKMGSFWFRETQDAFEFKMRWGGQ